MGAQGAGRQPEGPVAKAIEQQTTKIPSDWFLWAAGGAIGLSLVSRLVGAKHMANFVGEWVPTILILGLYNKMVKLHGSDPDGGMEGGRGQQRAGGGQGQQRSGGEPARAGSGGGGGGAGGGGGGARH